MQKSTYPPLVISSLLSHSVSLSLSLTLSIGWISNRANRAFRAVSFIRLYGRSLLQHSRWFHLTLFFIRKLVNTQKRALREKAATMDAIISTMRSIFPIAPFFVQCYLSTITEEMRI